MTSAPIRAVIVTEKISYIREMIEALRNLPLSSHDDFSSDPGMQQQLNLI